MNEKQLYTLKEIADELGVNYKTLYVYKDIFEDHLVIKYKGRKVKYLPVNIMVFSKLLELRDEGKSNEEMVAYLKRWRQEAPDLFQSDDLSDCLTVGRSDGLTDCLTDCLSDCLSDCRSDCRSDELRSIATGHFDDEWDVSNSSQEQQASPSPGRAEPVEVTPPTNPPPLASTRYQSGQIEITQLQLNRSLSNLESRLHAQLFEIIPQLNSALTQYYKVAIELGTRVEKLEAVLGVEPAEEQTELDLEKIQVRLVDIPDEARHADGASVANASSQADVIERKTRKPKARLDPADYADDPDLALLKKSIQNRKPKREDTKQWMLAMQAKYPDLTYADLARILDHAGVPTLTGRIGWNRGTLRSFVNP